MPSTNPAARRAALAGVEKRLPAGVLMGLLVAAVLLLVLVYPRLPTQARNGDGGQLQDYGNEEPDLDEDDEGPDVAPPEHLVKETAAPVPERSTPTENSTENSTENFTSPEATKGQGQQFVGVPLQGEFASYVLVAESEESADDDVRIEDFQCLELLYANNLTQKLCKPGSGGAGQQNQTLQLAAGVNGPARVQEMDSAQLETALAEQECVTLYLPQKRTRQLCKGGAKKGTEQQAADNNKPKVEFDVDWRGKIILASKFGRLTGQSVTNRTSLVTDVPDPRRWNTTWPERAPPEGVNVPKLPVAPAKQCPLWFGHVLRDLAPWADRGGIEFADLEAAQPVAAFRMQVIKGELYVERFKPCPESRAELSVWGMLMLLQRYPGLVPDLDLLFDCTLNYPTFPEADFADNSTALPVLFRYASTEGYLDIPWPDFTFWGWPERGVLPWADVKVQVGGGNASRALLEREHRATWQGDSALSWQRRQLVQCKERLWEVDAREGPEPLQENMCSTRYKMHIEGEGWTAGLKYLLACRSPIVAVKRQFYEFYSRGLEEGKHVITVDSGEKMCDDIADIVAFWFRHPEKAEAIGRAAGDFIDRDLGMPRVYDYMLHLLRHYATLQRFSPTLSPGAEKVTWTAVAAYMGEEWTAGMAVEEKATDPPCIFGESVSFDLTRPVIAQRSARPLGNRPPAMHGWGGAPLPPLPDSGGVKCPTWFKEMDKDLAPWRRRGGIGFSALEGARALATHRLQIVNGELYVERYKKPCFQSRGEFTVWGVLMLLRRYPGLVPDVDFMLECWDWPTVARTEYEQSPAPPLLLKYCSTPAHMDVPWPDFSFWGWPEVAIAQWREQSERIMSASDEIPLKKRVPKAHWRGNANMSPARQQALECGKQFNKTVETYMQDWEDERKHNYSNSRLENQCKNRYKIYVPGQTWSCSLKYILACKSAVLMVAADFFDFFSRGLKEGKHFEYVSADASMCSELDQKVKYWNKKGKAARAVGKRLGVFVSEDLSMDRVYDYMLHLLRRYAALQTFVPQVSEKAQRVDVFQALMDVTELQRKYLHVEEVAQTGPCEMPPPPGNSRQL